ncbi:MAG: hypothetical protein AAFY31_11645 [Pseudomonadota bacterium]
MSFDTYVADAQAALEAAQRAIRAELQSYPTPISGCDAQYSHLIGQRGAISAALDALNTPYFVATPRTLEPAAGVESR